MSIDIQKWLHRLTPVFAVGLLVLSMPGSWIRSNSTLRLSSLAVPSWRCPERAPARPQVAPNCRRRDSRDSVRIWSSRAIRNGAAKKVNNSPGTASQFTLFIGKEVSV